ncbi:hypothetical protein GIB67_023691 [Kingdonia uniflora]|uniref:Uncharacterized protein n=1 Tax=Kingdonia uniflora TaxID=39325 RepID=A0A7J7MGM0_9MAGN|nr:hypothetical protein GIB67_023691 [Kingdonia uniflora]
MGFFLNVRFMRKPTLTLSKLVFSTILLTEKESGLIFGGMLVYTNRIVQWAEWEIKSFIRLVKENAPSSETGLKLSKLLMVLLQLYVEEVQEMNFRRARLMLLNFEGNDDILLPQIVSAPPGLTTSSDSYLSQNVQQIISAIIARAIKTFSARGSEASDTDDEHITLHDEIILDSDDTGSCVSSIESSDSFASTNMGEVESLNYFTDPEA